MTTDTFAELHRRHDARLRRHAARMLRASGVDVDDVMQEVWIRAYRGIPEQVESDAGPWLHAVTSNCCIDALRRTSRRAECPAELDALPGGASPEDQVARRQALRDVLGDLGDLDDRQRAAFVRHVVDGQPHERIAAELQVSRQASRSLVLRARRNLERRRAARSHGFLGALLPGFKAKAAFFSATVAATGALFTLEREEFVEPAASPQHPEWKLPAGFGVARHTLTVGEDAVGRPLKVTLSCPRGYLLWQFDGARSAGAEIDAPAPEQWLGAEVSVVPARAGEVDVWAHCRPREQLERDFARDPRMLRVLARNSG
jgi:RNA polymerase sigma-70 factor (ECF subfamily)